MERRLIPVSAFLLTHTRMLEAPPLSDFGRLLNFRFGLGLADSCSNGFVGELIQLHVAATSLLPPRIY